MKKAITKIGMLAITLSLIAVTSCKKAEVGPKGETGATGTNGSNGVTVLNFSNIYISTYAGTNSYQQEILVPQITQGVIDSGAVNILSQVVIVGSPNTPEKTQTDVTSWSSLPFITYNNASTGVTESISSKISLGKITLKIGTVNGCQYGQYNFRVQIIK